MTNVLPTAPYVKQNNLPLTPLFPLTCTANGITLISKMNVLPTHRKVQVLTALVEGCSIRSIVRMTDTHMTTILRLLCETGDKCSTLLDETIRDLPCKNIQVDELWTFVKKKQRMLTGKEKLSPELGDQYIFIGMCADTKLIINHRIGKRDGWNAIQFMADLQSRLSGRVQLTTDAFAPYEWAVETAFGNDIDFATLTKIYKSNGAGRGRYAPPEITEVISNVVNGDPHPGRVSTSYVERLNLSLRMEVRRLTRLTNAFSKKLSNLKAAMALQVAWYNYGRVHGSLRVTPAMEAGITDHIWTMEKLLGFP